ncbi:hypothetical protein [Paenibacillus albus]|uniref:Uncharacterized protein n=1 Tax=Paenibacillus albus TaxID=2495582 RepID=A0A3S9A2P6_9BACL|nr:hypothetical protein [Paenibacillus albus]AZN40057.1 hypothetical protein EJC50_10650 [Paenibacillus albus]
MLFRELNWHALLRVSRAEKVNRLLKQLEEICGQPVTLLTCERYWKDSGLFDVSFTTPLNEVTPADAVFQALVTARNLAFDWHVSGPSITGDNQWEFRGLTTKTQITGIEWIQFHMDSVDG